MFWYNQSIETEKQSIEILGKYRNEDLRFGARTTKKNSQDRF